MFDYKSLESLSEVLRSRDLSVTTLLDGSGVLVDIAGMEILTFNPVGMRIVNRLREGNVTFDELLHAVVADFDVDDTDAARDADIFLHRLEAALLSRPRTG